MARLRVNCDKGTVACMIFYRLDGHELSLSSEGNSLVEWDGGTFVTDHGPVYNVEDYLRIVQEFLAGE